MLAIYIQLLHNIMSNNCTQSLNIVSPYFFIIICMLKQQICRPKSIGIRKKGSKSSSIDTKSPGSCPHSRPKCQSVSKWHTLHSEHCPQGCYFPFQAPSVSATEQESKAQCQSIDWKTRIIVANLSSIQSSLEWCS